MSIEVAIILPPWSVVWRDTIDPGFRSPLTFVLADLSSFGGSGAVRLIDREQGTVITDLDSAAPAPDLARAAA